MYVCITNYIDTVNSFYHHRILENGRRVVQDEYHRPAVPNIDVVQRACTITITNKQLDNSSKKLSLRRARLHDIRTQLIRTTYVHLSLS